MQADSFQPLEGLFRFGAQLGEGKMVGVAAEGLFEFVVDVGMREEDN